MSSIYHFIHLGRAWQIEKIGKAFFVRDQRNNLTGPYATQEEAVDWVLKIKAA